MVQNVVEVISGQWIRLVYLASKHVRWVFLKVVTRQIHFLSSDLFFRIFAAIETVILFAVHVIHHIIRFRSQFQWLFDMWKCIYLSIGMLDHFGFRSKMNFIHWDFISRLIFCVRLPKGIAMKRQWDREKERETETENWATRKVQSVYIFNEPNIVWLCSVGDCYQENHSQTFVWAWNSLWLTIMFVMCTFDRVIMRLITFPRNILFF